jgi:hypothetical protein
VECLPLSGGLEKFLLWSRGDHFWKYCENFSLTSDAGLHFECLKLDDARVTMTGVVVLSSVSVVEAVDIWGCRVIWVM